MVSEALGRKSVLWAMLRLRWRSNGGRPARMFGWCFVARKRVDEMFRPRKLVCYVFPVPGPQSACM